MCDCRRNSEDDVGTHFMSRARTAQSTIAVVTCQVSLGIYDLCAVSSTAGEDLAQLKTGQLHQPFHHVQRGSMKFSPKLGGVLCQNQFTETC